MKIFLERELFFEYRIGRRDVCSYFCCSGKSLELVDLGFSLYLDNYDSVINIMKF